MLGRCTRIMGNRFSCNKYSLNPVLGTCATFSATAPLARTEKGVARHGGAKAKNNGALAVARKENGANSSHFRAIFFFPQQKNILQIVRERERRSLE